MVQGGHIQGAGGVLIQPMPDCPEDVMEKLEALAPKLTAVSTMAHDCKTARELAEKALDGVSYEILGSSQPRYECDCSRERIERALLSMGEAELNDMIAQQHGAQDVDHVLYRGALAAKDGKAEHAAHHGKRAEHSRQSEFFH